MQKDRFKAYTDSSEPPLHHSLSNDIFALTGSTAKMFFLGLHMDYDVSALVFSLQIFLIL
jgi:hypothetical protein